MATVGNLFINVKARTASFSKKMKGVRSTVTRMAKGFGLMAAKVGKFAAVLGGIAVAALIAMTKAGLSSVDMVTKLALSMNTGTEGIIALQHAAKIGGVSVEKMDKAIGKMFKNVGEATMGLGLAKASLDELGLSAANLSKMQADEMFGAISEALSKVTDATTRAFHANALFGRSGIELIPIMLEGAEGIRKLRKEADELGITFGIEMGQMVEKANDAWARVGSIWKGLTQQLAIRFAPVLTEIANRIKTLILTAGGIEPVAELVVLTIARMAAHAWNALRKVQSGWILFKASVVGGAASVMEVLFSDETSKLMAEALRREAAGLVLEAEAFMPIEDIERRLRELREKFMGAGVDFGGGTIELDIIDLDELASGVRDTRGVVDTLQTAIGGFKVEGDSQTRLLNRTLQVEEKQLSTSEKILQAITQQGGGFLL